MNQELLESIGRAASGPKELVVAMSDALLRRARGEASVSDDAIAGIMPDTHRASARELLVSTRDSMGEEGWLAVAWALRAAAEARHSAREEQTVELVWSGPRVVQDVFRRTDRVWIDLIDEAQNEIWLSSYSCGSVAEIEARLIHAINRGVRVRCLFESKEDSGGYFQGNGIRTLDDQLLQNGIFYRWPKEKRERDTNRHIGLMHAKAIVVDAKAMFVTSANLSDAALSRNIEVGLVVRGGQQPSWLARRYEALLTAKLIEAFDPSRD